MPKRKNGPAEVEMEKTVIKKPKTAKKAVKPSDFDESPYNTQQKGAISEFAGVTQADKNTAAKFLKQHAWNVQAALNSFLNNPTAASSTPLRTNLNKLFDKYREDPRAEPDEINIEGTGKLLNELHIDLEDISALIFSDIVESPTLGKITREGFIDGWGAVNIDTPPKMRHFILQRRAEMPSNLALFKNVYNHTFQLALPQGSKTLPLELAIVFWQIVFGAYGMSWRSDSTPWLDWWVQFQEQKQTKAVNRDLWKQTLNFAQETLKDETLSFWNEESSWPSVVDEFVEWVKTEKMAGAAGDPMELH